MRQSEQSTGRRYSCGKTPKFAEGVIPSSLSDFWDDLWEEPQPGYLEDYREAFGKVGQQSLIMPPLPQVGDGKIDNVELKKDVLKYINP